MSEPLDLTGMVCPMPVLKTKKALAALPAGGELSVATDDPHAIEDLALFARQSGHELVEQRTDARGVTVHRFRRKA